ncbi:MAG: hypoxanthine phosphoribosyltransferase [Tunicatimonas sp.]
MRIRDFYFDEFISEAAIVERVQALAQQIDRDYADEPPVLVAVLNGAFVFTADLARSLSIPAEVTFIKVKSYQEMQSTGQHKEFIGLEVPIRGRSVIIVEDIVDSGNTIRYLTQQFSEQAPSSIAVATLLFKPQALVHNVKLDYVGFEIPNDFVVGYGLDYDGLGRNLRSVYKVVPNP